MFWFGFTEQYEKSIEVAKTGLKHVPDNAQLMFSLANVYGKLTKYAESEEYFNAVLKVQPSNAKFHANKGKLV